MMWRRGWIITFAASFTVSGGILSIPGGVLSILEGVTSKNFQGQAPRPQFLLAVPTCQPNRLKVLPHNNCVPVTPTALLL